jgi:hypothetical protein
MTSDAESEIRAQLEALRSEQAKLVELQQITAAKLQALEGGLAASRMSSNAAPSASEQSRLSVSGDLRLRGQGDFDNAARDRQSAQLRGRFGATFAASNRLTLGARMVTGDPDDPNSVDVQLSNFDDNLEISLDLAYAQLDLGDLQLYAGKLPQPFLRTDLVWDADVNPQGMSGLYRYDLGDGSVVRASWLFFVADEQAIGAESTMQGAQLRFTSGASEPWTFDLAAAYFDYRIGSIAGADAGDFRSNLRDELGNYRSDFDLTNVVLAATWSGAGSRWPVKLTSDVVKNVGAATSADFGYSVDLAAGRATAHRDWRITYGYASAQTDAVLAAFSHDNIGLATNYRLHTATLDYVPAPGTMISAIWYHYRLDEPIGAQTADWTDRVRLQLLVGF